MVRRHPSVEVVGSLSDVFLDQRIGAMAKGAAGYYYHRDLHKNLLIKVANLSRRGGVSEVIGDRFVWLIPGGPGPFRWQEMKR